MLQVISPEATKKIDYEGTEFEIYISLPIEFRNEYLDRVTKATRSMDEDKDFSFNELYKCNRDIVRRGLKSTEVKDVDGKPLTWTTKEVPEPILTKLSSIKVTSRETKDDKEIKRVVCLIDWLGQQIWTENNLDSQELKN